MFCVVKEIGLTVAAAPGPGTVYCVLYSSLFLAKSRFSVTVQYGANAVLYSIIQVPYPGTCIRAKLELYSMRLSVWYIILYYTVPDISDLDQVPNPQLFYAYCISITT